MRKMDYEALRKTKDPRKIIIRFFSISELHHEFGDEPEKHIIEVMIRKIKNT